ncbi:MAG: hypothetical protein ACYC61_25825 [Isosphaeraceae bacterium]
MIAPRQYTLGELMGLVAISGVGFALLTTGLALLGVGLLVVLPGFVLRRVRGQTGIVGGMISGCVLPLFGILVWLAIDFRVRARPSGEALNTLPALYMIFVVCLIWSGVVSCLLYALDRWLQGGPILAPDRTIPPDAGIRFLPDEPEPTADAATGRMRRISR